jgi:hypothetical protein
VADNEANNDDQKRLTVMASDLNRAIPKLASRVLLGKSGDNTLLTFVMDLGNDQAQVIETMALDKTLVKGLIKLLEDDASHSEAKDE